MQPEPLLEQEIARVSNAFAEVSRELGDALRVLAALEVHGVGTRSGESAVASGVSDLRSAITDLESVADDIHGVLNGAGRLESPAEETTPGAAT